jgi:hypothetical protein
MGYGKQGRPREEGERYPSGKLKPAAQRHKIAPAPLALIADLVNGDAVAVYVICQGEYEVKIGVSKNVGARSRALQTSNSKQLNIYWAARFDRADAFRLEKQIHKDFRGSLRHIRGEHYMMSGAEAVALIKQYAKKLQLRMMTDLQFGYGETSKFADVRAVAR